MESTAVKGKRWTSIFISFNDTRQMFGDQSTSAMLKRKKVASACQRCRRQKLKCDVQRPCTLCQRAEARCDSVEADIWRAHHPEDVRRKRRRPTKWLRAASSSLPPSDISAESIARDGLTTAPPTGRSSPTRWNSSSAADFVEEVRRLLLSRSPELRRYITGVSTS